MENIRKKNTSAAFSVQKKLQFDFFDFKFLLELNSLKVNMQNDFLTFDKIDQKSQKLAFLNEKTYLFC